MYTRIRLLLHIYLFLFSFFFLSNFQALKVFVTLFLGTVRPRRLKLGAHMDNGWMYCVYRNQAAAAYSSLCFSFFFLSNFQALKIFFKSFLGKYEAKKVETSYKHEQWVDVLCIPKSVCCCLFIPLVLIFLSLQFSNKKFCCTLLSNLLICFSP